MCCCVCMYVCGHTRSTGRLSKSYRLTGPPTNIRYAYIYTYTTHMFNRHVVVPAADGGAGEFEEMVALALEDAVPSHVLDALD